MRDLYAAMGTLHEIGDVLCLLMPSAPQSTMLNRAAGVGLTEPATEAELDEIVALFTDRGCSCSIPVAPDAQPPQLTRWLEKRGFSPGYAWMKFRSRVELPPPVDTDLRVEEIGDERSSEFGRVIADAYGIPGGLGEALAVVIGRPNWHCYLAFAGEKPAAGAALHAASGLGWLGIAGSLPDYRRRGGQNALFAARMRKAVELGLKLLVTETGERLPDRPANSYRNILRNGFEEAYLRPNWVRLT